ncbi:MAG: PAS domain S-box protein [Sphingomonadales bacterium]|nr:PAS domain S-box protein [Sphingomonadales bacterium]
MQYIGLIFLSLSIILLSYAAFTATKLIRVAMWKKPWAAFTIAINIFLFIQAFDLYDFLVGNAALPDAKTHVVELIIAMLMAYVVYHTSPEFRTHRNQIKRQEKDKIDAENRLAIINKFSSDLIKLNTPDDLVWYVASEVVGHLDQEDCMIYLLDEDSNCLVEAASIGSKRSDDNKIEDPIRIPMGKGITGWAAQNKQAIIVDNVIEDERYIAERDFAGSEICVPIINEGRLFGIIDSENPTIGFYTEKHLDIMQTIASMLAFRLAQWDTLEKLSDAKQTLVEAQSISHCGNWFWDIEKNTISWSDEAFRIYGFEPQSFEPTYSIFLSLVPEAERGKIDDIISYHVKNGITKGYDIDHPVNLPDGSVKYVNEHGIVTFDDNGRAISMSGTVLDVTERKIAEMSAKAAEEQLLDVFALAPEAIITFDNAMNIEMFNKGAERIFLYTADEIIGKHLNALIPQNFHQAHKKHLERFIFSDEEYQNMDKRSEITGLKKDGTIFPAMASVSKQQTKNGFKYTVLLRDITKKLQSETKLKNALMAAENANLAKSSFLAAMSHELRTPLNAIMGFSQVIDNIGFDELGKKRIEEYAGHINQSSRTLLQLFNNVLDISSLEANEYKLKKSNFEIEPIIKEGFDHTLKLAKYKNINISYTLEGENLSIYSDPQALQKIIINSLANAIQFTPNEGDIHLSVKSQDEEIKIKITSSSANISSTDLIAMQNPMDIGLDNPYHAIDGTRLNLLIVKSLVELHKGKRKISSDENGKAYISISLPTVE